MYEQSIQGYDEALRFGAQEAFTHHNRGGSGYFSLGQYERSLAGFARALDQEVESAGQTPLLEQYIKSLKMVR